MKPKQNRWYTAAGLLLFFLLSLVPSGQAQLSGGTQQGVPVSYANVPAQLSLSWTFTSSSSPTGGFSVKGMGYWQLFFVPVGTVSACSVSFDSSTGSGFTTGGVIAAATIGSCASAASYANSTATTPTLLGQLTPTITGTGSVTVVLLGYVNNPATSSGGGGSVTITSPVDGSNNVKVNCEVGCAGGSTTPSDIFSNPSTAGLNFALNGMFNGTTWERWRSAIIGNAVAGTGIGASSPYCEYLSSLPTLTNATYGAAQCDSSGRLLTNPSGVTQPTQPAGFGSAVAFQQAVTASAVALSSNTTHSFCVQALASNAITVYVGPSGVTTSTGFPLAPGVGVCYQLSNSNLLYVIASTTGASVAVTGE